MDLSTGVRVNSLEWPVPPQAGPDLSRTAGHRSPVKPLTRTRPPALVSTVTSDRAAVDSFVTPAAPHSSQVFSRPISRLASEPPSALPPVQSAHTASKVLSQHQRPPMSIDELRPTPIGSAFKSATFIRTVPLPALHPTPPAPLHVGVRYVNMYKERYLPTPTCSSSPFVEEDPYRARLVPTTQQALGSSQADRLRQHQVQVDRSRWLQRTREYIPHRTPLGYALGGEQMQLRKRYELSESELRHLHQLQKANALYYGKGIRGSNRSTRAEDRFCGASGSGGHRSSQGHGSPNNKQLETDEFLSQPGAAEATATGGEDKDRNEPQQENSAELSFAKGEALDKQTADNTTDYKPKRPSIMLSAATTPRRSLSLAELFLRQAGSSTDDLPKSFITDKHEQVFGEKFDEMDVDGDGKISLGDLRREMMECTTDNDIAALMEVFDLNNDQTIDKREFVAVAALNEHIQGLRTHSVNDVLQLNLSQLAFHINKFKQLFLMADDSSDGHVETSELMILLSAAFGLDAGFDHGRVKSIMDTIDKDNNGTIEFVEFLSFIPFFLKLQEDIVKTPLSLEHDIVETAKLTMQRRQSQKIF